MSAMPEFPVVLTSLQHRCRSAEGSLTGVCVLPDPTGSSRQALGKWDLSDLASAETQALPLSDDGNGPEQSDGIECPGACIAEGSSIEREGWADHVSKDHATHAGFWKQAGTVKTESLVFLGYFSILSGKKLFKETTEFHFKDEGWFGKDTANIGVDKLTHAFDTYLLAEFLHSRIHRRSNASEGDALTAAMLASGLMIFNEFSDGIEPDSGWSVQDVAMNLAGAGFSVLRNTVPGLKEKVSFKIEIVPNGHIYSYEGKPHYEQQRFMFSIKGAGFKRFNHSPLRFLDLQVGYYASDFLNKDREAGIEPKRHVFVGVGLNVGELLFGNSESGFAKAAYSALDYVQLPYTSIRYDTTGRFGT
ncbi:Predicted lipoprotein [Novosphingobium mathurense]|uniref:Predicted lipoprotein n=1 Tax=Novosphingobium mathurense TaxID=428990 RepID=A0A1U6IRB4_9SPHN|nr:Predicted lipoprotein [Novosphingobium mathurense]